jgi:hypothetical protein
LHGASDDNGIGFVITGLGTVAAPPPERELNAFLRALADRGYVQGRNMDIEWRSSEGDAELLPGLAMELVRAKVDIILATALVPAQAAIEATKTVPIVFVVGADPVGLRLIGSVPRPGGNATGLASYAPQESADKVLQLLKAVTPKLSRLGVLTVPSNPAQRELIGKFATKEVAEELLTSGFSLGGKYVDANSEPATVIILPVIRIDRDPDGSNGFEPDTGNSAGRRRRRRRRGRAPGTAQGAGTGDRHGRDHPGCAARRAAHGSRWPGARGRERPPARRPAAGGDNRAPRGSRARDGFPAAVRRVPPLRRGTERGRISGGRARVH